LNNFFVRFWRYEAARLSLDQLNPMRGENRPQFVLNELSVFSALNRYQATVSGLFEPNKGPAKRIPSS
jgi:hypothetical protein